MLALQYDISGREKGFNSPQGVAAGPVGVTPDSPAPLTYLAGCGHALACSRFLSLLWSALPDLSRLYADHTRDEDCPAAFRNRDTDLPLPSTIPTCKPEWRGVFGHMILVHPLGRNSKLDPGHCTCSGIPGHFHSSHRVVVFSRGVCLSTSALCLGCSNYIYSRSCYFEALVSPLDCVLSFRRESVLAPSPCMTEI